SNENDTRAAPRNQEHKRPERFPPQCASARARSAAAESGRSADAPERVLRSGGCERKHAIRLLNSICPRPSAKRGDAPPDGLPDGWRQEERGDAPHRTSFLCPLMINPDLCPNQ